MLSQQEKWAWLGYLILPIVYLLKIGLISSCTYVGLFLVCGNKVRLRDIFPAVIKADMIFLIPAIIKLVWFTFNTDYTIEDIQYFMPGSLLNFFESSSVEKWLVYPLQAFNIFEVAFWFVLAYQLKEFFKNDFTASFQTVALSYGSSFVVWVVFVVFLTLNLT
jgi:hypothetical protein